MTMKVVENSRILDESAPIFVHMIEYLEGSDTEHATDPMQSSVILYKQQAPHTDRQFQPFKPTFVLQFVRYCPRIVSHICSPDSCLLLCELLARYCYDMFRT